MPMNNPFGYMPQFMPTPTGGVPVNQPQIPLQPQIPQMPGLQSNFQLPSLGSLIQPQQTQQFDLMAALQQGNQQISAARDLANRIPNIPKPVKPEPVVEKSGKRRINKEKMMKENRKDNRGR